MPDAIDAARRLIESRLAEIEEETRRLERAVAGLSGRSGSGRRRGRPRKRSTGAGSAPPKSSRGA